MIVSILVVLHLCHLQAPSILRPRLACILSKTTYFSVEPRGTCLTFYIRLLDFVDTPNYRDRTSSL